jgi:hypothetical protein
MSSTVHSPLSTSSDVVLLPHLLNHVNHNHTESSSTTKSLKRSRSPSLTRDNNNQIDNSPITTDTSTKKSRKKRNTTDIDQSLGRNVSADKLHIYHWPTDEPHADLHVLQEQICDYLSLKSFKRKYPDIYRRIVDLQEREYLKSQNVVTETQCDLGLTALKLDEVLQLMSTDYPEKCHQFNHVWQQKRRTFLSTNNHSSNSTTPTLLSASISNQLSSTQSLNSLDNGDKNRSSVCWDFRSLFSIFYLLIRNYPILFDGNCYVLQWNIILNYNENDDKIVKHVLIFKLCKFIFQPIDNFVYHRT